jgi:hypothetical protein
MFISGSNIFKDATVAYSLRDLGLGATNVVRVRRDSDNAEQDFTASQITDGTLDNFLNGANGFVSKSYNQVGGDNATQSSANLQPSISNGSISYNDDYLEIPDSDNLSFTDGTNNTDFTILTEVIFDGFNVADRAWLVSKRIETIESVQEWQFLFNDGSLRFQIWDINGNRETVKQSNFSFSPNIGQKYVLGCTLNGNQLDLFLDGVIVATNTISSGFQFFNGISPVKLGNEIFVSTLNFIGRQNTAIIWKGKGLEANEIAELNQFFN